MSARMGSVRRVLTEPGTPYARLALAGMLGLAAAAATIGLLAGSGYVVGRAALRPGLNALVGILALVEVLAFLRGPLRYGERLVGHDAALRALTGWRVWLYDCLTPRVPAALAGWRTGDLLSRAVDDVDTLQDLYLRAILPLAIAVPGVLTWRRSGDDELAALSGTLSADVVDALRGAPELLAFGADDAVLAAVEETARAADALDRHHARLATGVGLISQLCLAVAVASVLALGVAAVHADHLGQVMVAVLPLAVLGTFEPVAGVPLAVSRALAVRAAADRLDALADVPVPVVDPADPEPLGPGTPDVRFAGASLRYGAGLPRALDRVDLHLPAAATLAVTGSSGAGKTSLVHALLRFWPLESGRLTVGDTDVARLSQDDARLVCALADQRAHLFAGSVRSNLTLGRPEASADEIDAALRAARLEAWVDGLPEGLDTPVGEDGVALSGGERRRLAVARALLAPGPVIVLDEPTSGLDPVLADQLLDGVVAEAAAAGRSVLLVTHRAAEAARCDATVALEAGRVVPAAD